MQADNLINTVLLLSVLGTGLIAGVFYAFSAFVMKALGAIQPLYGIEAMQSINVVVINRWFMLPFLGMTAVSPLLMIGALLHWQEARAGFVFAGGLCYFVGTFLVTMLCNVPLNNRLAAVAAHSADGAALWADYLLDWTRWNHVRAMAALISAALFMLALLR